MSLPMLRPHCEDVSNKGLIKSMKAASILLHDDPDDKFQLELEEFIFCGHILTCYVGKYSIIVLKTLIGMKMTCCTTFSTNASV